MAQHLAAEGHEVVVLDSLATGHRGAVKWGPLVQADLLDKASLASVFKSSRFDAVMHFAAKSLVGESVADPYSYYANNVSGTLNLLSTMREHGVGRIVFSSTAAVFGEPLSAVIDENHPKDPINPYGASKLMAERLLSDAAAAYGLRSVSLRYFNAAGALPQHGIGEAHVCETHLIPNVLRAALGKSPALKVFGSEYGTPDGTCVRDYVHVQDLARAHALALEYMDQSPGAHSFNLGNGQGFSVLDVIQTAEKVAGMKVPYELAAPRAGDPARLVASAKRARSELGWQPTWTELGPIMESAWRWHKDQPAWSLPQ